MLLVERHEFLVGSRLAQTQFHHLIIDGLTAGGVEGRIVGAHHALL